MLDAIEIIDADEATELEQINKAKREALTR